MRRALALLLAALAWLLPGAALADERILDWKSDIQVREDASLDVTETIRVEVELNQINHGIYRDFPTTYGQGGRKVRVGFDVLSVQRDGHDEPYDVQGGGNGVRIQIGSGDVTLDYGEHTYVIHYTTTRQLGFFDGYDELYWNVTGNGWGFPIDRAEARIRLPQPVAFGPERAFYTGPQGASDHNAAVVSESPGDISIMTTAPLGPYEGLTVAVRWPKGVVTPPPGPTAAQLKSHEQAPLAALLIGLLGIAAYYFYAWKRAGRGPRAGTVVPLFTPPDDMSAAGIRYVKKMGFDNRCFAAAVVECGVHRELKIEEHDPGFLRSTKTTLVKTTGDGGLGKPEAAMLQSLFAGSDRIEMDDANHVRFEAARSALNERLDERFKDRTFLRNLGWAWFGMLTLVAAMLLVATTVALTDFYTTPLERMFPLAGFGLVAIAGLILAARVKGWPLNTLAAACAIGAIVFLGIGFIGLAQVEEPGSFMLILAPLLLLPLSISAFFWMAAPTREGRELMDRIAGFEQYLSITEEDRLEAMHPPEKTPELFERYLPHAVALGVENNWADKFAAVLAAAAADPTRNQGNTFGWYSGSNNVWSNPGRFVGTVGSSLASGIASASTAPGSSSGSGGGGSSGGGGGGGGGGGW